MAKVEILYDKKRSDFYVKIVRGGEKLPDNIGDFMHYQREILAKEFPEHHTMIINPMLSVLGSNPKTIKALIDEYNAQKGESSSLYIIEKGSNTLCAVDLGAMDRREVTDTGYTGGEDEIEVLNFITEKRREYSREEKLDFKCPKCGTIQFQRIQNGAVRCNGADCGERYPSYKALLDGDPPAAIAYCSSDRVECPKLTASKKCREAIAAEEKAAGERKERPRLSTFTYKDQTYRITRADALALHQTLYRDFACDRVFRKGQGGIEYREDYLRYLQCLADHGVMGELYRAVNVVLRHINSMEYSIRTVERAFYWYFSEYRLSGDTPSLVRKGGDGKIYTFRTPPLYVRALLAATGAERSALRELFDDLSCTEKGFFAGYEDSDIELSRLIYDCEKIFVYIKEDSYENFGADYIAKLTDQDDKIALRSEFLRFILSDGAFCDRIKGASPTLKPFRSQLPDNYDMLCYYRFEIEGRACMHFKSIEIKNSAEGWNYIKQIIRAAYLDDSPVVRNGFRDLAELAKCPNLCDELNRISSIEDIKKYGNDMMDKHSFRALREALSQSAGKTPSVSLYLSCCDPQIIGKPCVYVKYNGSTKKLEEHVKSILAKNSGASLINEWKAFYEDPEVQEILHFFLDRKVKEGYKGVIKARNDAFEVLKKAIDTLTR